MKRRHNMINEFYPPISTLEMQKMMSYLPPSYCKILIEKRLVKSKQIGKKTYISEKSIQSIKDKFKLEDYYTVEECNSMLTEMELKDNYDMIRYGAVRKFDFNISVKQLVEKNYLQLDDYVGKYITKHSFDECVIKLKTLIKENEIIKCEMNKKSFIEKEAEKLLDIPTKEWLFELKKSKDANLTFNKLKPTLSKEESLKLNEEAERLYGYKNKGISNNPNQSVVITKIATLNSNGKKIKKGMKNPFA